MPLLARPSRHQVRVPLQEYAVDLFYRAADAALDSDPAKREAAAGLFALARQVMQAAEQAEAGEAPLAAAVSSPTARLRGDHGSGVA